MTTATCRTSTPQLLKKKEISQRKLTFDCNELMYNFLLHLWLARQGTLGGGGAVGQETLPVGSGGAGNVPAVSCSWAKNGESWILRRVSAGICASGKRKQELMSLIVESGTFNYLNAPHRLRVDEPIRWLSYKNSSVRNENKTIHIQNLSVLLTGLIQASSSMFA